jgi:hypothetical protein
MKTLSNSTKNFFKYSFKGNGKYYTTEQGSRSYKNTDFYNFYSKNNDCINIVERGNDAPKGGKIGNFLIVEFNQNFYNKYQHYFDAQKKEIERQANYELLKEKSIQIVKNYAKNNWNELKELVNHQGKLQEKLNLPIVLHTRLIRKVLYSSI